MTEKERYQRIDELIDGSITDADFLLLEAELRVNPEARVSYYERIKLSHALDAEIARDSEAPVVNLRSVWVNPFKLVSMVAAVLVVGLVIWIIFDGGKSSIGSEIADAEPEANGYAVLAEYSDASWSTEEPLRRGDLLPQGPLQLNSGIAQLEFFSGVTVIIEGQADFEVLSPMELKVNNGRVRALVPSAAHGFKISTSTGDIIDLGTEFALDVTTDSAEMHVLDGEIEWHPNSEDKRLLTNGESLRWTETGLSSDVASDASEFSSISDIEQGFRDKHLERLQIWESEVQRFQKDSGILAFYPINETAGSKRLVDDVAMQELHGTIVSARRVSDRWGRAGSALNFSPAGSRVRVSIPGEHRSLTFYCWVRIDSLDRRYNSLFLTDGHELNEPHWQIMNDGRLFFSVKRREDENEKNLDDKHIAFSPSFWDSSLSGKWFQIATVYNVDNQTTSHFVNGKEISRDDIGDDYIVDQVRIGAASIGNWNEPTRGDPRFALRNLNGAIDEFAIFSRALSEYEIYNLYQMGRP